VDDVPDIAAERNTSVFPSTTRCVREKMDVDDDVCDDDEGRCFKSKPNAALRHAAHIIFFVLLL
jgi:hypothetical protein